MAKTRTTHVRRISKYTEEELAATENLVQMWVDIERTDTMVSNEHGHGWQKSTRKIFWADEALLEEHPTRTLEMRRIYNPNSELQYLDVPIMWQGQFRRSSDLGVKKRYKNNENVARQFTVRRVYNGVSDPVNPNSAPPGTPYTKSTTVRNENQYVDTALSSRLTATTRRKGQYLKRFFRLNVDPLKEYSEESPLALDDPAVVHLDPYQNIVNVNWGDWPEPFIQVRISLYRRMDFGDAEGGVEIPPSGNLELPIRATLISYTPFFFWPFDPTGPLAHRASPPFDIEPDDVEPNVTGMPSLPGVSSIAAGVIATPGSASRDYGLQRDSTMGIKFGESSGGPTTSPYGDLPEPEGSAAYGTEEPAWGSTLARVELYRVLFTGTEAGTVLDAFDVDFGDTEATIQQRWTYSPIAFAGIPRQYGALSYADEGIAVGANANHVANGKILFQINNPPPGYDPS